MSDADSDGDSGSDTGSESLADMLSAALAAWDERGFGPADADSFARSWRASTAADLETFEALITVSGAFVADGRLGEALAFTANAVELVDDVEADDRRVELSERLIDGTIEHTERSTPSERIELLRLLTTLRAARDRPPVNGVARLRFELALALKDEGQASGSPELLAESIEVTATLVDDFGDSPSPALRNGVAWARYNSGGPLIQLGRSDEARALFAELAGSPTEGDVASYAAVRHRMMLSIPTPPYHVESSPIEDTWIADERAEPEQGTDANDRAVERANQAIASHGDADTIVRGYHFNGAPFALFLRTFASEGSVALTDQLDDLDPLVYSFQTVGDLPIEARLADALGPDRPLISLGNRDAVLTADHLRPRLFLSETDWQPVVEALIEHAAFVVLYLDGRSAGIDWEIEVLARHGRARDTLVVDADQDDHGARVRRIFDRAFLPAADDEPSGTSTHEALAGFPFRVDERAAVEPGALEQLPPFRRFVEEMDEVQRLDPERRMRRLATRWAMPFPPARP